MDTGERVPTGFERRVYDALCEVPAGKVTTYGALALRVGVNSARAVGQALRRNPFAPQVPCHRVIASDLSLGGFAGQTGGEKLRKKRRMLEEEGVEFDDAGRLLDSGRLQEWSSS